MKYILIALITFIAIISKAQDKTVTVSSQGTKISVVIGDEENDTKIFSLNIADAKSFLSVCIDNKKGDKDWKRNFAIYDSTGNSVKDFTPMKSGSFCIKISDLKPLLQPIQTYYIYTTAVPVDPQKAMLVKMGRQIICALKIR